MLENSEVRFSKLSKTEQNWPARLISKYPSQPRDKWVDLKPLLGERIGILKGQHFWNLSDLGNAKFKALKDTVKTLLNSHNEDLKKREPCTMLFDVFMIGKKQEQAHPTLVLICVKKEALKRVAALIRDSKILDEFEGVQFAAASRDPRYRGTAQSVASGPEGESRRLMPHGTKVYTKPSNSNLIGGRSVYIPLGGNFLNEITWFRMATIGGFLDLIFNDGATMTVGMTVAHAFEALREEEIDSPTAYESDDSNFEFDFIETNLRQSSVCDSHCSGATCESLSFEQGDVKS